MQKILRLLIRVVVGVLLFILVVGFVIVPWALTWIIPSQATKILKHPVHLRSVEFNPFLSQMSMEGLEILDDKGQVMVGFDRMLVVVNIKDLFKKIYHVEDFELNGLKVRLELLPGNKVNLMDLIPASPATAPVKPQVTVAKANASPATPVQSQPLPVFVIDTIDLHGAGVDFVDHTITPTFATKLSSMELHITHVTSNPDDAAKVKFQGNIDDKGQVSMECEVKPLAQPLELQTTFSLNGYALGVLTPYCGKYTGRSLKDGKLSVTFDYTIGGRKLSARHKLLIQQFEFGSSVQSKDALHLPFGLIIALLEDPQGRISIALPVSGDMSNPKFKFTHLIFQVIGNFFTKIVTSPFSALGSALGASSDSGTDELGYVRFLPGRADLIVSQKEKLITLIKTLKERPKLRLEIDGSYDPDADWRAIQADIFTKDYAKLRKDSSRPESHVYQLLYQRRFGIRALWALAKKYKEGVGEYKDEKLDQEIKRQLIQNAPPDTAALGVLAQARAELIHNFFITNGLDAAHLSVGRPKTTQASMGYVLLEFTLTVFDK